jgi:hypothetical protein
MLEFDVPADSDEFIVPRDVVRTQVHFDHFIIALAFIVS